MLLFLCGYFYCICRTGLHISNFDADIKMSRQARGIREFSDLKLLSFQSCRYGITLNNTPSFTRRKDQFHQIKLHCHYLYVFKIGYQTLHLGNLNERKDQGTNAKSNREVEISDIIKIVGIQPSFFVSHIK